MKVFTKNLVIVLLMLFIGCAYYNTFFNAKKFFKEAEDERKKQQTKQATQVKQGAGISSSAKQKYTKAIEKASKLLEFYPKSKYVDDALFLLGQSFFYKTEYRKAKRKFEELINNFPESEFVPEARLWLGKTNTELRDYETAEKNFQDILSGKAKQKIIDEVQFLLGGLHFHKEDYIIALREYETTAKHAKDKALRSKAYFQMGECYLQLKDYAAAATSFEKARKYSPDVKTEYNSYFKAGLARKELREYDKAIDVFRELLGDINNEDNWPECKFQIAECLYLNGELSNAISWYESLVDEHKKTDAAAKAYFNLGTIYQNEKSDYEQAKEYYELASKEYSRSEIVPQAKANFNSIKNMFALKEDIKEQEKRIAAGDSIAAAMDSLEVDSSVVDLEDMEQQLSDSTLTSQDSLARENGLKQQHEDENKFSTRFPKNTEDQKKSTKKLSLKSGELGTPEEELIKDKLMLAEIYLFDFNQPDSAMYEYLEVLQRDTTAANASKAAYSIGFIFANYKNEPAVADSIFEELIKAYPNTVYAENAREYLGLPALEKIDDMALKKFKQAEKEYIDHNNYKAALTSYEKVVENYPESALASKSLYAMGWIYENNLNRNDKALEIYQKLVDNYSGTKYANDVKKKINEVNKQHEQQKKESEAELASQKKAEEKVAAEEKTGETKDTGKESYREILTREMQKDNLRIRNPKRIIK